MTAIQPVSAAPATMPSASTPLPSSAPPASTRQRGGEREREPHAQRLPQQLAAPLGVFGLRDQHGEPAAQAGERDARHHRRRPTIAAPRARTASAPPRSASTLSTAWRPTRPVAMMARVRTSLMVWPNL